MSEHYCFRAEYDDADAAALQALEQGKATEQQQKRALTWIIEQGAATYQVAWEPDSERSSSFQAGRRYVGLQIIKLIKLNLQAIRSKRNAN